MPGTFTGEVVAGDALGDGADINLFKESDGTTKRILRHGSAANVSQNLEDYSVAVQPNPANTGVAISVILPTAIVLTTAIALAFVLTHKKKEQF